MASIDPESAIDLFDRSWTPEITGFQTEKRDADGIS